MDKKSRRFDIFIRFLILFFLLITSCNLFTSGAERAPRSAPVPESREAGTETALPSPAGVEMPTATALPPWSGEWLHNPENIFGHVEKIVVLVDKAGKLHVAWVVKDGDSFTGTYLFFYETREPGPASAWSQPVEIYQEGYSGSEAETWDANLALGIDSQSHLHLAWLRKGHVYSTWQADNGNWATPETPETGCPACQPGEINLAIDSSDNLTLAWSDFKTGVIYTMDQASGGAWSSAVETAWSTSAFMPYLDLLVDPQGQLHIFWESTRSEIRHAWRSPSGQWSAEELVSGDASRPGAAVVDANGTFHVVWPGSLANSQVFWYVYKGPGGAWVKRQPVQVSGISEPGNLSLVLVGEGDLLLMWRNTNGFYPYQWITKSAGEFWSESASVPRTKEDGVFALAGDPSGLVHLVWDQERVGEVGHLAYEQRPFDELAQPALSFTPIDALAGITEFPVKTGANEFLSLAIGGGRIVWNQRGNQDYDVFGFDPDTRAEFPVSTGQGNQFSPHISGDLVVFGDYDSNRILAYDLASGREFPVTAKSSPQFTPDISGDIVVFNDWRKTGTCSWGDSPFGMDVSCDWDIWGVDLASKREFPVATSREVQRAPRISEENVIWIESPEQGRLVLYTQRIGRDDSPIMISDSLSGDAAIDGNFVVWADSSDELYGIYAYSLLDGQIFPVSLGASQKNDPDISGNLVVWSDWRSGDADIFGYNLATGQEFAINLATGDQTQPVIDGDLLAWFDQRSGNKEIYAARLPGLNSPQVEEYIPAPTPSPTPLPEPTAIPLSPIVLFPENGATVDTLLPVLRFDAESTKVRQWGIGFMEGDAPMVQCNQVQGTSEYTCEFEDNLLPGKTYTWNVHVIYDPEVCPPGDPCSSTSPEWTFTTPTSVPLPGAPQLVFPADGASLSVSEVGFKWNPVDGATQYQLGEREKDSALEGWLSYSFLDEPPSGILTGGVYTPGVTYEWGVRARNYYGWGPWSVASFTVLP